MKIFFLSKARTSKEEKTKSRSEETILKQGREQFKKLVEKGLNIPVALL